MEHDRPSGMSVSILTRAEARVLQVFGVYRRSAVRFQSSPAPRRGCCVPRCEAGGKVCRVSILTRAEARVLLTAMIRGHLNDQGFNPHPRRGAGAACSPVCHPAHFLVSILTRAEARVLLYMPNEDEVETTVSILTRAEARVLPLADGCEPRPEQGFNPHPRRGAGAAPLPGKLKTTQSGFQSSPAPRRGCCPPTARRTLTSKLFQSSPAPRRGCCCSYSFCARTDSCFNPHPRRGAGAAVRTRFALEQIHVSILTRAEARVLPACSRRCSQA